MLESLQVKRAVVRSGTFLLRSLVGAIGLYMATTAVVLTAGLVSLVTGWYQFTIESGPLAFLGYTMLVAGKADWAVSFEFSLLTFFILYVVAALLLGLGSGMRALGASLRT